jgi:hypothetical protein
MTEQAEDPVTAPATLEIIKVTGSVPVNLLADYDRGVSAGYYASREALRHGLTELCRHRRGRYCTVQLDLLDPSDQRRDTSSENPPETAEPDAGEVGHTASD